MAETSRSFLADLMSAPVIPKPAIPAGSLDQPYCQPVIIGNISGANLLTSAITNREDQPKNAQLVNILPLNHEQLDTSSRSQSQDFSPSSVTVSSACSSSWFQELDKNKTPEPKNKSCEAVTKVSYSENCRYELTSSDTIIISQVPLSTPDTLPASSLFISSNESAEKTVIKDASSSPCTSRPFSLLTNISDRSVSLESIPSSSLFQLDHEHASNISLYKVDSFETTAGFRKVGFEQTLSEITGNQTAGEITVLGSNGIPESIMHLMKQINQMKYSDKQMCLVMSPDKASISKPKLPSTPDQEHDDPGVSCNLSSIRLTRTAQEGSNDTSMETDAVPVVEHKENQLSRSDTVILTANKDSAICTSPGIHSSDTFILSCDDKQAVSSDKSSEGFSFSSLNSYSPTSLKLQISEPLLNKSLSVFSNSSVNQICEPLPVSVVQSDHFSKSLYVVTNDGHLAAVKYISPDPLDVSQLIQLGLFNSMDANHQILNTGIPEVHSRNVEVKETQTELAFGTNTLQFKFVDSMQDNSTCLVLPVNSLVVTNSVPEETSFLPPVLVITDNAKPPDQSHSSEKIQGAAISLAEPTGNEIIASGNPIPLHQVTEISTTPIQTSEPGLPETVPSDKCAAFKCMECQDTFETNHDLVSHEKLHKKGFKCDLCNATFTRIGNFTRHRKIHNLETESQNVFKCSDCGREFLQRCDLKRHLLIHAKQEPHRCEKCGKGYIRRSDLIVHMRFHNKDKAFKCSMCDKKFFQTGDLNRHVRRAHMPNSHLTCGHCNRKYACESTLIRHMKAAHKDIILRTVNEKLQESNPSDKSPSVNTKDILFTMTKTPERKQ